MATTPCPHCNGRNPYCYPCWGWGYIPKDGLRSANANHAPRPKDESRGRAIAIVIPEHVVGLSPEDQVEWFNENDVGAQPPSVWEKYYVQNTDHRGLHCNSCIEDQEWGYMDYDDEFCCCKAYKEVESER